jgi:hypothetical protein
MSIRSYSPLSPVKEENGNKKESPTFSTLLHPLEAHLPHLTPLVSGSNRPLSYTFAHQIRGLVYYHTAHCESAQDLLESARCDGFVNQLLIPKSGLGESTFYEASANRGGIQMVELIDRLSKKACKYAGISYAELGHLVVIDGSLISASLSMTWADYRKNVRKAKMHLGLDLQGCIPRKMILTQGNGAERPFVSHLLEQGETGVLDRGYQDHRRFDCWIEENKHFVVRLRKNTKWEVVEQLSFEQNNAIFFFAKVVIGHSLHKMTHPLFVVGFKSRGKTYWIATDRNDLTAQQIAFVYSLRWQIETFFAWWKKYLNIYHLFSRNPHGVWVQLLSGLITYLLLVIYFYQKHRQKPCVKLMRRLKWDIHHDLQQHIYISHCLSPHIPI